MQAAVTGAPSPPTTVAPLAPPGPLLPLFAEPANISSYSARLCPLLPPAACESPLKVHAVVVAATAAGPLQKYG